MSRHCDLCGTRLAATQSVWRNVSETLEVEDVCAGCQDVFRAESDAIMTEFHRFREERIAGWIADLKHRLTKKETR
jgi:hypothetical protein